MVKGRKIRGGTKRDDCRAWEGRKKIVRHIIARVTVVGGGGDSSFWGVVYGGGVSQKTRRKL